MGFWKWVNGLSNRIRTSIGLSIAAVGFISTVMSIAGVSLNDWTNRVDLSILIIFVALMLFAFAAYLIIGIIFRDSVSMNIQNNPVSIECGDIFAADGWKVIGCDTHFDTRVDDIVISKTSLHGKLILEHGDADEIKAAVKKAALRLNLPANDDGFYDFPLGTIVRYDSSKDNETYLMLAMTKLDQNYESHTTMAEFEHMLMKMWSEIGRVYASHDIVLPLLGSGISRFDGTPKSKESLLKCMLCTLNASGEEFNAKMKIVIFGDAKDIPLYEYRDMFRQINKRK